MTNFFLYKMAEISKNVVKCQKMLKIEKIAKKDKNGLKAKTS